MKLIDKLTIWLVGAVFLITPFSMIISYRSIASNVRLAEIARLQEVNDKVAGQLRAGTTPHKYMLDRPIVIKQLNAIPAQKTSTNVHKLYNSDLKREESRLDVVSYYKVNKGFYSVSTYNYITDGAMIWQGMLQALVWKMLLITIFVAVTARIISRYVLSPFENALKNMESFSLRQKEEVVLSKTSTAEFKRLNFLFKKMTDIALEDYSRVKEFSENASHEVQTPLAVIRTKLELLAETDINESQAMLMDDMQNAVEKLVKINRSLLLLTKLDNHEYESSEHVKFCRITKDTLRSFEHWIQLKNLAITQNIGSNIPLRIHPALAEMLVTNLLSNAIRHNVEGGILDVTLTPQYLTIKNSGLPPEIEPELLFLRFKKSNQSGDSIGLGLSIVKQICAVNNFTISYTYAQGAHILHIDFSETPIAEMEKTSAEAFVIEENVLLA